MNRFIEMRESIIRDSGQYSITISRLNVILSKKVFGYYDIILAFVSNKVHQYQTISVIS
ncbi:hypothetical protein ACWA1C_06370 [Flectobacillus roseus]